MRKMLLAIMVCSALFMSGCMSKIQVNPELQLVSPADRIKIEYAGAQATLVNQCKVGEIKQITGYNLPAEGIMHEWTKQAIEITTMEIQKRGGNVGPGSGKDIYMTFEGDELVYNQWSWSLTCKGTMKVETGSGYKQQYPVTSSTGGTPDRACGGAITVGVIAFLNDKNIVDFMAAK